ncbi:MAG: Uncharacterised protein [Rhodospirillaceae bacterium]|nr:MAG: Uncharacterised protein [Rhodospirillaceae bacterium]
MTSTSGRTGTGLKKCKPISRSGWLRDAAISSIIIEEVFVASIAPGLAAFSTSLKTACLTSSLSATASMMISAFPICAPATSAIRREFASAIALSVFRRRSNRLAARKTAFSTALASLSDRLTENPFNAATAAISPPIVPAPITCTWLIWLSPRAVFRTASLIKKTRLK